ncbi:hypothetical protein [Bdellovibrio sp. HCB209]|uniref:hypothetical protein n=1 Tax=Bdellovibrio sp. HCB209 TaxID=3394354 RepID=UPI0039B454CD
MINKVLSGLLLVVATFSFQQARAEYAAGIMIGDPIGFTGRMSLNEKNSVDLGIGASSGYMRGLQIHSTFLFDKLESWETASEGPLNLYTGAGARLVFINDGKYDGDTAFGPRVPVGITFNIAEPKMELLAEAAMTLNVAPKVDADLDVVIGARLVF